jgi:dienelactone hydrolase
MRTLLLAILFAGLSFVSNAQKTITYKSTDGTTITADLYTPHKKDATFILLCHRARWSRGEYLETAPKLNELGYNCMAPDHRSGGQINDVINQTKLEAERNNKQTRHIDTYEDIISSIKYIKTNYPKAKLVLWGSSYSSSLVLRVCGDNPNITNGVMSFSPGEYFSKQGKSDSYILEGVGTIKIPVFITSAREEKSYWEKIFKAIPSKDKVSFIPKAAGLHGSRVLWDMYDGNEEYWIAVKQFLKLYF